MSYFRPVVDALTGYTPGEQPPPGTPVIKLNTNENPYPPSPKAVEVLRTLDSEWLRRYPDPYARLFCRAVSQALGVPPEWVIVTNGSDELLNVLVRACAEGAGGAQGSADRKVVYPTPTYVLYPILAAMQSAQIVEISYAEDFQLPLEALVAAQGALTLIASPNSPSGHLVPLDDLRQLARDLPGVLAIDEAYTDFADYSALPLVEEFDNVIVLRTLSKGYSLAGLRLGFGVAQPPLLEGLFKLKDSYNIDAIATAVGTAAMTDQPYKVACAEKVKASRARLQADLKQLGFTVPDSQGNFLLATPPSSRAEDLYQALKARGILVRYFNRPGLDDKLRITVGTEAQNQTLIEALVSLQNLVAD